MDQQNTRRQFLKTATFAGIGMYVSPRVYAQGKSPNERVQIACIGVGGKGRSDMEQAGNHGDIVAICDCDDKPLDSAWQKFPLAKKYNDYRKMLEEMGKGIDAVVVSTPDHHHAPASVMAMRLGKHVYCQKPLTHSVWEARLMRDTARKMNVATQMGNQGTAHSGLRTGVEVVRSGAIGNVRELHVWTNRPFGFWKQAPDMVARPTEMPPVPANVHWEEFIGAAQMRPYHPIYHPFSWRGWWDFGTGALGDMACHTANMAFMALKLNQPMSVSAEHSEVNSETYPAWATITFEFAARGDLPPVKMVWYEGAKSGGRNLPHPDLLMGEKASDSGSLLIGDKGVMFSPNDYGAAQKLLPAKDFADYRPPAPTLPRLEGGRIEGGDIDDNQKREWVAAIKGGQPAMSNFDYAATLTETILLGNVAVRTGHRIQYDGRRGHITNCKEADSFLKTAMREGWKI